MNQSRNLRASPRATNIFSLAALLLLAMQAQADHRARPAASLLPQYQQECGACHLAFPPGLLPAPAWQSTMATLDRHYGTDASLDALTTRNLRDWLTRNAASEGRRVDAAPPENRITRTGWFQREHRGIAQSVWKNEVIGSPANCAACHRNAVRGDFDEDSIAFPAGIDRRVRGAFHASDEHELD